MPIKEIINDGIGFAPGTIKYIPLRGFSTGVQPPGGGGAPPPSPAPALRTGFTTYGGGVISSPQGQPSQAYIIRNDVNQIAILDTVTSAPVDFAVEYFHSFTGDAQSRTLRKKIVRFEITGKGVIYPGSYLIIVGDEQRSDVYTYSMQSPVPQYGLLWKQQTMGLVARQFDVAIYMMGVGIEIAEARLEYTPVG